MVSYTSDMGVIAVTDEYMLPESCCTPDLIINELPDLYRKPEEQAFSLIFQCNLKLGEVRVLEALECVPSRSALLERAWRFRR
jgi:hypothetical protein